MIALLIANSLALASLLIMMASGLALIYGLRDVINFGHGALYMLGAYLGYSIAHVAGFWVALVASPLLLAESGRRWNIWGCDRCSPGRISKSRSSRSGSGSFSDRFSSSSMAERLGRSMRRRRSPGRSQFSV